MRLLLWAFTVWLGTGVAALFSRRSFGKPDWIGPVGAVVGSILAAVPALRALLLDEVLSWASPGLVPGVEFALRVDALSAWFVLTVVVVSSLAAIYGWGYLGHHADFRAANGSWFFYLLLLSSTVLLMVASDAWLFLAAWELMALSSFFLVAFEHRQESVWRAGWLYLVASQAGAACLTAFFLIATHQTGTTDLASWAEGRLLGVQASGWLFGLALIGFGSKAGLWPVHVWLPEAHPAAPSHVSAVMSGVMIKAGVYGLVRSLTFLGEPPVWWGWTLLGVGLASAMLGILLALVQRDLKRLLAYSSVENVGLITAALGLGLLGITQHDTTLAVLGMGGALLHVANHALFKSLLFMGAGAVAKAVGTRDMECLGGLHRRMPWTASGFVIGAAAICGLPPFNGFVSEWCMYLAAFQAGMGPSALAPAGWLALGGLALTGGLAAACFAKAFAVFLGTPRTELASDAQECTGAMLWPMGVLAAACVALGFCGPVLLRSLMTVLPLVVREPTGTVAEVLVRTSGWLQSVSLVGVMVVGTVGGVWGVRQCLLAGRPVTTTVTWDCGYARPTERMQYTGSSFVQPLATFFAPLLRVRQLGSIRPSLFPQRGRFIFRADDLGSQLWARLFGVGLSWLARLRWLQQGRIQLYILYLALVLLIFLLWKVR